MRRGCNTLRYGHHTKHQHACVENFLAEGAKWGLGKRELVSNSNWYMNVPVPVANRGEIACRIIRNAALGLRTVAVYSDADRGAPQVGMAEAAVRLGPAPARESYLRSDAVIDPATAHSAGAAHHAATIVEPERGRCKRTGWTGR